MIQIGDTVTFVDSGNIYCGKVAAYVHKGMNPYYEHSAFKDIPSDHCFFSPTYDDYDRVVVVITNHKFKDLKNKPVAYAPRVSSVRKVGHIQVYLVEGFQEGNRFEKCFLAENIGDAFARATHAGYTNIYSIKVDGI